MVPGVQRLLFVAVVLASLGALGCPRVGSCSAQDVNGLKTGCSGPAGYMWTGSGCVYTQACNCTGSDCEGLYAKKDICEAAHTHCL